MTGCLIGIGSNLGDRAATIRSAIDELAAHPQIKFLAGSALHATDPVGGPSGQGEFLNAALRIDTSLTPDSLMDLLFATEGKLGRIRTIHWGPRTIDLDLLLYGEQVIDQPGLQVPHPRLHERRFVLVPAAEIAGEMVHPTLHCTIKELLAKLDCSATSD